MRIGVPKESVAGERRVALSPDVAARLVKAGHELLVERGAGQAAYMPDATYEAAGATLTDTTGAFGAEIVTKVQTPTLGEASLLGDGGLLISLLQPGEQAALLEALSSRGIRALSLERVPRITRAQSMDILSSQATIAGYKAVLLAAAQSPRLFPMLTTAAGNIPPAKAFVLGAGVAGLQAIATARRLGAIVSGFDIRAAAAEQVLSLGATFVGPKPSSDAEVKGGYAREQTEDERRATTEAMAAHLKDQDVVITTAQIPGRAAPRLVTRAMVESMRPGAVIVDLAADSGGNCELTKPGDTIDHRGVAIIGASNLPSSMPYHASLMFSKNVFTLLSHLISKEGVLAVDPKDEITGAMLVTTAPVAA
ncbi:MAG: NAD(P) transhydrogenase subunit alpha part 1 [Gemmatimonadaceae bacterium]|nr:NAD(P) transhydrogenase subunit alpha part 1 [Gemmatimonadaceae bacterium]